MGLLPWPRACWRHWMSLENHNCSCKRPVSFSQVALPYKAPQGQWCPVAVPGSRTPILLHRPALASGKASGPIPRIPASAGKGNEHGSSFPSALPSLAFAPSQPQSWKPLGSRAKGALFLLGNGSALGLSLQQWFLTLPPMSLGLRGSCCHSWVMGLPFKAAAQGRRGTHSQTARQSLIKPSPGQPLTLPPAFSSLWLQHSKGSIKSSSFTGSLKKKRGGETARKREKFGHGREWVIKAEPSFLLHRDYIYIVSLMLGDVSRLLGDWSRSWLSAWFPSSLRFLPLTTMNKFLCCTLVVSPFREVDRL